MSYRHNFLVLNENIYCDPSLELETILMMGHKIGFYGEVPVIIPKLSLLIPLLVWSTGSFLLYSDVLI